MSFCVPCSIRVGKFHVSPCNIHADNVNMNVLVTYKTVSRIINGCYSYPYISCGDFRQCKANIGFPTYRNVFCFQSFLAVFYLICNRSKPRQTCTILTVLYSHSHSRSCGILTKGNFRSGLVYLNKLKALCFIGFSACLRVPCIIVNLVINVILTFITYGNCIPGKLRQTLGWNFLGI